MSNYLRLQRILRIPYQLKNLFSYQLVKLNVWRKFQRPPKDFRQLIADEIHNQTHEFHCKLQGEIRELKKRLNENN